MKSASLMPGRTATGAETTAPAYFTGASPLANRMRLDWKFLRPGVPQPLTWMRALVSPWRATIWSVSCPGLVSGLAIRPPFAPPSPVRSGGGLPGLLRRYR